MMSMMMVAMLTIMITAFDLLLTPAHTDSA